MVISLELSSPFYMAYETQAEIINAAIEKAIEESASKMGNLIADLYPISVTVAIERKAA